MVRGKHRTVDLREVTSHSKNFVEENATFLENWHTLGASIYIQGLIFIFSATAC